MNKLYRKHNKGENMVKNLQGKFTKTALSVAILAASGVQVAAAQDLEEIYVTGVRSSLSQSLDIKRNATSIVDSIASEELGRFPDNNVADSLSHIPGITVSRNRGGEAENVNIRGLGPEFSIVTLNNRILATDDSGRNFAFDVMPSEMISGADVWKSVQAKNIEGSIGGAVNLKSVRPLDQSGLVGALSIETDHNSLSEEWGTKFNGVVSNTFADDTFGIVVGITSQSGTDRADDMFDNFFFGVGDELNYDIDNSGTIEANEMNLVAPGSYALGSYATDFERTGLTSAIQWRPTDRLEITADVLVTKLESDATGFTQSFYMVDESDAQDRWTNITTDGNVITGMDVSDLTMEVVTLDDHRTVDTSLFGLNGVFQATDNLTLSADAYRSESERLSGGKNTFVVAGSPGSHTGRFDLNEGGLPDFVPTWTGGRTSDDFGNDDFAPHWAARDGSDIKDTVTGFSLDGDWEFDMDVSPLTNVEFGVAFTSREKTNQALDNYDAGACNYCGYPYFFGDVGADVVRDFPYDNLFDGESGNFPRSFPIFDIPSYAEGLAASDGQTLTDYNGDTRTFGANESALWDPVPNPVNSYDITEDTTAFFVQANFEGDDWFANVGARYVQTEVSASYSYNQILTIDIVDPNVPNPEWIVTRTPSSDQTDEGDYKKLLPALNFGKYLQDDLLLRVAFAQSMSRPTIDQLAPLTTDNAQSGVFDMTITGNPAIEPVFSDQLDVGLEWYFDEDSIVYGTVFWKELDGFITDNTTNQIIAGENFRVTQPINGDTAEVLGLEFGVQRFFDNGFGVTASYAYTDSSTVVGGVDAGALPGVADNSYSLSGIYEKDKISAQVSLDYTGDLVEDQFSPLGDDYNTTREEVSMVTASFRYDIIENAQLYVEGLNLLNESNRTFQGRSDLPGSIQVYGRTINFGARYTF